MPLQSNTPEMVMCMLFLCSLCCTCVGARKALCWCRIWCRATGREEVVLMAELLGTPKEKASIQSCLCACRTSRWCQSQCPTTGRQRRGRW